MDKVCDRCVVLKGLPNDCTEQTVNEILELAHDDFRFKDKYDRLSMYREAEDDMRCIVLFKTEEDADNCFKSGSWMCNTAAGRHRVVPDYCADCIVPDEWVLNDEWVVTESLKQNAPSSLSSESPESFVTVENTPTPSLLSSVSPESFVTMENTPEQDELTDDQDGAVGFNHRYISPELTASAAGEAEHKVESSTKSPLDTKQTHNDLSESSQSRFSYTMQNTTLVSTRNMYGSGKQEDNVNSTAYEDNVKSDTINTDTDCERNTVQKESSNESAKEIASGVEFHHTSTETKLDSVDLVDMFGSGLLKEQQAESKSERELVDEGADRLNVEASSYHFPATNTDTERSQAASNDSIIQSSKQTKSKHEPANSQPDTEDKDITVIHHINQNDDNDTTQLNNDQRNIYTTNEPQEEAIDNTKKHDLTETTEQDTSKDNDLAETNQTFEATFVRDTPNITPGSPVMITEETKRPSVNDHKIYDYPQIPMPIPMQYPTGIPSNDYHPYQQMFPYGMPVMMMPPPGGNSSANGSGNSPDMTQPTYFQAYIPPGMTPLQFPANTQQPYPGIIPYPYQMYPQYNRPIPKPRQATVKDLNEKDIPEDGNSNNHYDYPKPGVNPVHVSSTAGLSTDANTDRSENTGNDLHDDEQEIRSKYRFPPRAELAATGFQTKSNTTDDYEDYDADNSTDQRADYDSLLVDSTENEPLYEEIGNRTQTSSIYPNKRNKETDNRPPIPAPRKSVLPKQHSSEIKHTKRASYKEDDTKVGDDTPYEEVLHRSQIGSSHLPERNSVLVKGITDDVSQEMLELLFENKRYGGGEVEDITIQRRKREAVIVFSDEKDASSVLNRAQSRDKFIISGVELDVCRYVPSLVDPLVLFVTNMAENTTKECIVNFMEAKTDTEIDHIEFGEDFGTALLFFKAQPDVDALQKRCKARRCDGAYLNISAVEKSKSIRATGLKAETSTEVICLYFENKRRSQGGDVENVRRRQNVNGETEYIVTFVKYEDAERVLKNKNHSLDGQNFTICLHYACMELDEEAILIIPKPIIFDEVNKWILKFLRRSEYYHDLLERKVRDIHGKVVWNDADDCLVVECTLDQNDKEGHMKVKDWTSTCLSVVEPIFDGIVVTESTRVACEVFEDLKVKLRDIQVEDPNQVSVFPETTECYMVVVGTHDAVKPLADTIQRLIDESERQIYEDNQVITKKRKLIGYQMVLLGSTKIDEKLKASLGILEIDFENKEYIFKGRQKDVDNGIDELEKVLRSFVSKKVADFPKQAADFIYEDQTRDYIKHRFYKERIVGVWNKSRNKEIFMNGRTEKEVNKASEILMKSISVTVLRLPSEKATILSSQEGQGMISDLERKHEGQVKFDTEQHQITIISTDKIHDELKAEFDKLFDVHTIVTEFLPAQQGRLDFVKSFQRNDLSTIETQYQRLHVTISIVDNPKPGFQVSGKKDGCKLALNKLQKMLDSVNCKIISKSWPGLDSYLSKDEGRQSIRDIELKNKCVVKVMAEKIKRPSSSEEKQLGATGGPDVQAITITVVTGSLVDENVDVVVNSTNRFLDLKIGVVSRTLLKAGGDKLEAECKAKYPDGISVGDIGVTKAGGQLKCHTLYHGLLVKWDNGQGHAQMVMEQFIDKCLSTADSMAYKSIAFPALGTGALGFPTDLVAKTMFAVVKNFETSHPNTSLKDVHFIVWEGDQATVKAFKSEYAFSIGNGSSGSARTSRYSTIQQDVGTDVFDTSSGYTAQIDNVAVSVSQGDLTAAKTEAIVNSTIDDLNLNSGNISKVILNAAGPSIQTEAYARKQRFLDEGLVVTNSGKLYCQRIIHVRARNSEKGWTDSIVKTFETVETLGLTSVAFPALGTGGKGFTPETIAKLMIHALQKYKSKSTGSGCLKSVQIIIYDPKMVGKFVKGVEDTVYPSNKKINLKFWQNKSEPTAKVTLHIYAESSYIVEHVATRIEGLRLQETILFSPKATERLDDRMTAELLKLKPEFSVDVEIGNGRVVITGFGTNATAAVNEAKRLVTRIEDNVKDSEITVSLPESWAKMTSRHHLTVVPLKPNDTEFVKLGAKFVHESRVPVQNIVKIERIQNTTLYAQFISKKSQMEALGGVNVEQQLWHGTDEAAVANINSFGFNRNYNTGSSHGVGVYFAVNASTSVQGYCRPDTAGYKHIYLAHVLTGDYVQGSPGIRVPPQKPGSPGRTYDSTTDNVQSPSFFVTFHDAQAYPAYHITFK